jgi:hypothetical protein
VSIRRSRGGRCGLTELGAEILTHRSSQTIPRNLDLGHAVRSTHVIDRGFHTIMLMTCTCDNQFIVAAYDATMSTVLTPRSTSL